MKRSTRILALGLVLGLSVGCAGSGGDGGGDGSLVRGDTSGGGSEGGGSVAGDGSSVTTDGGASSGKGGPVGSPCDSDDQCTDPPDAECFTTIGGGMVPTITFPGGFCSKGCTTGSSGGEGQEPEEPTDCGSVGTCASFTTSGSGGGGGTTVTLSFCTIRCNKPEDCRLDEGYRCHFVFPGFPGVCTL